jgi:hypothetical protein
MVDDRPEDIELAPDLGRPKRTPPTLDLEPTEVSDKSATEVSDKSATEASGKQGDAEMIGESAAEATGEAGAEASGETASGIDATNKIPPAAVPRTRWIGSALIAAVSGAGSAALILFIVWLSGSPTDGVAPAPLTPPPSADQATVNALAARVASLEANPAKPASGAPDGAAANRIDALETSMASLRGEVAASRSRSEKLAAAVEELRAAPRDAPPPDLSAITERLTQLERASRAQIAASTQQNAKPADDTPLRRVVAATLLDLSVRHGEPYGAALEAAKALAPDPAVLKPLDPFAASGVPGPAALSRDLLALLPKTAPAPEAASTTGAGIVDRLQAGAARLVRIQRTDTADPADRSAVIMRAAEAAQRNDLAKARRELDALQGADRAAVQGGIDRLGAHDAALAASRQFAADALAALTKTAP